MVDFKKMYLLVFFLFALPEWANALELTDRPYDVLVNSADIVEHESELEGDLVVEQESTIASKEPVVLPEHLGPVLTTPKVPSMVSPDYLPLFNKQTDQQTNRQIEPSQQMLDTAKPWIPTIVPFLDAPVRHEPKTITPAIKPESVKKPKKEITPATILEVDVHPKMPRIAILIDDLGYNRHGMESSLLLPTEVALAILPSTPFALQTALTAQKQKRITLLHAPMENQRELKLGPGGLYANMTEHELKDTLSKDLDSLPGIQGANNHMGSLLTTKADSMKWVMEILKGRSLFFIDSLTSPKSVAKKTAQEYGLETVSRDVFLDNIRTEQAIDRQFSRLLKLAKRHGSALAIGHPYPETMTYLKKRLNHLDQDGVCLVKLSDLLISSPSSISAFDLQ